MGREKGKRKGKRACNHLFYDPLPPNFGAFEVSRFQLWNCWNVSELESFSNFLRDYFVQHLSVMRVRTIWSVKRWSVGNTRLLPSLRLNRSFRLFSFLQSPSLIWITESDFLLSVNVMWWCPTMNFVTLGPAR